jgi:hypothetical protein
MSEHETTLIKAHQMTIKRLIHKEILEVTECIKERQLALASISKRHHIAAYWKTRLTELNFELRELKAIEQLLNNAESLELKYKTGEAENGN